MTEQKNLLLNKPQINISYTSNTRMWLVSLCAFFCIVQSAIKDDGQTLIIACVTLITVLITEFLLTWRTYGAGKIKDGSAVVTALILTILLPNQLHPAYAVLGALFAIVVVKHSFGGLGSNWLNPALGGWLFIRFSWSPAFSSALAKGSTSIGEYIIPAYLGTIDNSATEFLNNTVFSITGVRLPSGYIDLLFNNSSSVIADRGLFFLLIGTVIITAARINRGFIPLVFLFTFGFFVRLAGDLSGLLWNGDILYGFFSGGTVAAAFILAAEPSSSTRTRTGVIFNIALGAILAWAFRYKFMEYTGCFIAVAIVNCLSPVIKLIEEKLFFPRTNRGKTQENTL